MHEQSDIHPFPLPRLWLGSILFAISLPGQPLSDIPLRNWPAPLYWQPPALAVERIGRDEHSGLQALRALASGERAAVPTPPLVFVAVQPCRVVDTRGPAGIFGGPIMSSGQTRSFPIPNSGCGIPSTAQAYSLNFTVVPQGSLGYLTAWPTGQSQPVVSTLNSLEGRIVANAAIVPAGENGAISVFVTNSTNVVIDINGYFAPQGGTGGRR